jgi:hypothetical protein
LRSLASNSCKSCSHFHTIHKTVTRPTHHRHLQGTETHFFPDAKQKLRIKTRPARAHLDTAPVAQTSKSAVSRVSKPANGVIPNAMPTWKSAIRQVWKPALRAGASGRLVAVPRCSQRD